MWLSDGRLLTWSSFCGHTVSVLLLFPIRTPALCPHFTIITSSKTTILNRSTIGDILILLLMLKECFPYVVIKYGIFCRSFAHVPSEAQDFPFFLICLVCFLLAFLCHQYLTRMHICRYSWSSLNGALMDCRVPRTTD